MTDYSKYLTDIEERKNQGLNPKPIDNGELLSQIIDQIKDSKHPERKDSINFFMIFTFGSCEPES